MGVLDTTVKQLILVKADTSQAKQAIKELSGEEKKAAKERLDDIERQNSKLESSVRSWTKVAAGVAGAVAAYKLMSKAAEAAIEDAKRSGTAGEGAAKAWTDATKKWDAAVNQLMVSFGKLVIELAPLVDLMAELVSQIAQAIDMLNHPRQAASDFISLGQAFGTTANAAFGNQNRSYSRMALDMGSKLSGANPLGLPDDYFTVEHMQKSRGYMDLYGAGISRIQDGWGALAERLKPKKKGKQAGYSGIDSDAIGDFSQLFGANMSAAGEVFGALRRTYEGASGEVTLGEEDQTGLARLRALLEQAKRDVAEWNDEVAQMQRERQQSFLESIFGPVDQFNLYAEGFNMLTDAARSAFDAWITGSESIGKAVKRAVAESLRALAGQALVESLKHAAFAVGSFAFGDFRGAATHGLAAAKFAGVAVAAGLAAKEMGAGQSSYGGSSAGASAGAGGYLGASGVGQPANVTNVVYLPPDWDDRTPGEKAQALARVVKRGSTNRTNNIVLNH